MTNVLFSRIVCAEQKPHRVIWSFVCVSNARFYGMQRVVQHTHERTNARQKNVRLRVSELNVHGCDKRSCIWQRKVQCATKKRLTLRDAHFVFTMWSKFQPHHEHENGGLVSESNTCVHGTKAPDCKNQVLWFATAMPPSASLFLCRTQAVLNLSSNRSF